MTRTSLLIAAVALSAMCAHAQLPAQPIFGTEVFISPNWALGSTAASSFGFDNIVLEDQTGAPYTITFDSVSAGTGTYGPTFPEMNYIMEFTWLTSSQASGFTAGHSHLATTGGNPGAYENTHNNVPGQDYQGIRITRVDGQPFRVASFDYRTASVGVVMGTAYTGFADIAANFVLFAAADGMVLNDPNWNTFIMPGAAPTSFHLAQGAVLVFNQTAGTFAMTGTIASYETASGFIAASPAIDPVIGASVTLSGNYTGTDTTTLNGMLLVPAVLNIIVSPGADELAILGQFVHNPTQAPDVFLLGGAIGCEPMIERTLAGPSGLGTNRVGSGSAGVDSFDAAIAGGATVSLATRLRWGGSPSIASIHLDHTPTAAPTQANMNTSGTGSIQVGVIGLNAGDEIFNVFQSNPTSVMPGGGLFFGIGFGPEQVFQLTRPLGAHPFHVMADINGAYFWGAPAGTVPAGVVLDMVTIGFDPATSVASFVSDVIRRTF